MSSLIELRHLERKCVDLLRSLYDETLPTIDDQKPDVKMENTINVIMYMLINRNRKLLKRYIQKQIQYFRQYFANINEEQQFKYLNRANLLNETSQSGVYKVDWKLALPLIKRRKVKLSKGQVYIEKSHFLIIACYYKIRHIVCCVNSISNIPLSLQIDVRIDSLLDLLKNLMEIYENQNKSWNIGTSDVNLQNLNNLSQNFPPCMYRMYEKMESQHYLRYNGRQQFIPFLKDIGLNVEDALIYFKNHSANIMDENEYKKKRYEYYIKYQYGITALKRDISCYDCSKMKFNSVEDCLDCHGCPFLSESNTRQILSLPLYDSVSIHDKNDILSQVGRVNQQKMCAKLLAKKLQSYNETIPDKIDHPLQYFGIHKEAKSKDSEIFDSD